MKKSTFVAMILGTIGGILFALGMCMALIPEWNAFRPGVVMGTIGAVVLLIMVIVWRKMEKKNPIRISGKTIGTVILGIIGALLFGVGMCLTMVWSNMIIGIVIGIVGIVVLLCLIPLTKGLKWIEIIRIGTGQNAIGDVVKPHFTTSPIFNIAQLSYTAVSPYPPSQGTDR